MEYSANDFRYYQENSLSHHGILGMKWGIRRYQNKDGTLTPAGKIRYGVETVDEAKEVIRKEKLQKRAEKNNAKIEKRRRESELRRKKSVEDRNRTASWRPYDRKEVKKLSDEEIQKRIDRLKLEQSLKEYSNNNKSRIDSAKSFVGKVLKDSGSKVATAAVTAAGMYAVRNFVRKQWGDDVAREMFGGKK